VVVPLLFTDAFHARIDVPAAVRRAAESSGLELVLAPILGTADDIVQAVADRLAAAGTAPEEPVLIYAVGSSRTEANAAVADVASRLADRRGTAVRAGFGTSEPRAADVLADLRSTSERPGTVVPLFVAPGLLLDAFAPVVTAAGWRLAEPLGTLLAPQVSQRYRAAIRHHQESR
jgi:sirohydrochlorin cobaltochelatase